MIFIESIERTLDNYKITINAKNIKFYFNIHYSLEENAYVICVNMQNYAYQVTVAQEMSSDYKKAIIENLLHTIIDRGGFNV